MPAQLTADDVIGEIYEASYKPQHWPVALEKIARFTDSDSAAFVSHDAELDRASGAHTWNISDDDFARYNALGIDPNFLLFSERVPLGTAAASDHLVPVRAELEQMYGDEFSQYVRDTDHYHIGGAVLFMDDVRTAGIGLQRHRDSGVWQKGSIERLNVLIPHLQRALTIQKEFVRLQVREQALRKGLDQLLMGMVLYDAEVQPVYINPVAESILGYHPAISLRNNKIVTADNEDNQAIHAALLRAMTHVEGDDLAQSSTALGLRHPDSLTVMPVMISPIQGVLNGFEANGVYAHVAMCFSDAERSHPVDESRLRDVYGFTSAEAEVTIALVNGMNADEIANMKSVAISTVRSQLKSVYHKAAVHNQAELVKVVLGGPFTVS